MNYFYDRTKAIFFGEDIILTEYYIGCHSVGKMWNALILVDNMFLYCRQLKVLTPQIWRHHVFRFTFYNMSNFVFSDRTYFDGTLTSKIWLCGTEKLKGQLQSFNPKCLGLGWEFINKIPLIILLIVELSRWIWRGHFLTEYSSKFQINGACYQIIQYFQSF